MRLNSMDASIKCDQLKLSAKSTSATGVSRVNPGSKANLPKNVPDPRVYKQWLC